MLARMTESRLFMALGSLRLSLWLLMAQLFLFGAGAIQMPLMKTYATMNSVPLMPWMLHAPARASWWLWASVLIIAALALNTLACGLASLLRRGGRLWSSVLPPQLIHLGFLMMMAGHMVSSLGAVHAQHPMAEGSAVALPAGAGFMRLGRVEMKMSPEGYPTDWTAYMEIFGPGGNSLGRATAGPNRPHFTGGLGIYIKQAAYGGALMEVHREPGTPWALGGGALFTLGTLMLIRLKMQRER